MKTSPAPLHDLVPAALRAAWAADGSYPQRALFSLFAAQVQAAPEAIAVATPEAQISYQQLHDASLRLANALQQLGVGVGDVVACQLPNHWHCCVVELATVALGAIIVPLPPGRGQLDLLALLRKSQACVFIANRGQIGTEDDICHSIAQIAPQLPFLRERILADAETDTAAATPAAPQTAAQPHPGWHSLSQMLQCAPLQELPSIDPDSAARFLISSGTEAEPKLVAYSHNALAGGRGRFLQRLHADGQSAGQAQRMHALFLVPLGSSFGSLASFGVLACLGGTLVLQPKFDPAAALTAMLQEKVTHVFGVPTMFQRLVQANQMQLARFRHLRALVSGGALIDPATISRCIAAFGCPLVSLYGSADGVNCHTMPSDSLSRVQETVGKVNPAICSIRIVNEQRQPLPVGEIGEIAARGPITPMQYVQAPELDAAYRDSEGWVYTGDLGFLDEAGYLTLAGRKKDIIIRGGVNISPAQIERVISIHPQVISAVCVPVQDADLGQKVALCLVLAQSANAARMNLEQVRQFLLEKGLARNKLPQYLHCYQQLPLTPAGKIDKRQLIAAFEAQAAA